MRTNEGPDYSTGNRGTFRYGTPRATATSVLEALLQRPPLWKRWHGIVVRRCGWCRRFQGFKWVGWGRGGSTTHGICRPCKAKVDAELDAIESARPKLDDAKVAALVEKIRRA